MDDTPIRALELSPLFAGLFALVQIPLTIAVGLYRVRTGIQFLDGGDAVLLRRMRAHANFTETVPMALIAMAAAEWSAAPRALETWPERGVPESPEAWLVTVTGDAFRDRLRRRRREELREDALEALSRLSPWERMAMRRFRGNPG